MTIVEPGKYYLDQGSTGFNGSVYKVLAYVHPGRHEVEVEVELIGPKYQNLVYLWGVDNCKPDRLATSDEIMRAMLGISPISEKKTRGST